MRVTVPVYGDDAAMLTAVLERNRRTFAWKCAGMDAASLRATTAASTMTLAGLLKHLALVEDHYFTGQLQGRPLPAPWAGVDFDADPEWEWRTALDDDPEDLRTLWRDAVLRSRAAVEEALATGGPDQRAVVGWGERGAPSLRRLMLDMIEEYARHTGHADLLREAVDGATGEGAPEDFAGP